MKYILAFLSLFVCAPSVAQVNLVMNPSLEQYTDCPDNSDEITYANHWMCLDSGWIAPDWADDSSGVPEYCNICATFFGISVPYAAPYYHYPHTGNGMAQVQVFCDEEYSGSQYLRDYLQGHLLATLTPGQSYCVTFYVALEQGSVYATNHIGAYLDNGSIDTSHPYEGIHTGYIPQILDSTIILDSVSITDTDGVAWEGKWVKVQGSFVANGTERLITIANFSDKIHTNAIALQDTSIERVDSFSGYTWYLVDDISVIKSDATPDAGPDRVITGGITDSVTIGDTIDTYLPMHWYANGVLIDSNKASLKVRPDTTTAYVVALMLCTGAVYDTVVVWDESLNTVQVGKYANVQILPNPATNELNVTHAKGCELMMYDMVGRAVLEAPISIDNQVVDISTLQSGVYVVQVIDETSGYRVTRRVVKE